ncbi:CotH kinase family protein [Ruminococcus albus]|uniref:CotH protein n=1 Tax=Ruminococcus albus TaxID=1264 RepID=A0A1I1PG84_RUMAL|nr:CotH kinase family protein [Ruminococcus albus]SFD08745.1 CotH protein [Ruminococcus albus]
MSANKNIDRICAVITVLTLLITILFCNGQALGIEVKATAAGYEARLFDRSKVHTLDIVMDDWDSFIETCESEEYSACSVVIDGEAVKNVGIRGKGNTSLSSVKNMDSSRYSFKIEFDQYEKGKSYHGLDKLCLNNIIQDNSYMKDYLAYTMMYDFGVDTPLCSYVYITVNGEDWGLYLAVEAIEDSFLERNYGSNYGELYKPDSLSFGGGGPGNGKDFSMGDFMNKNSSDDDKGGDEKFDENGGFAPGNFDFSNMPDMGDFDPSQMFDGEMPDMGDMGDFDPSKMFGGENGGKGGFGGFGMGSDDVKLKYSDDDEDSYSNIFGNAKTIIDTADKKRLIKSIKNLTEQTDIENTVDTEEVIRYFVVHNFLCNGDSYTGQMIHNYYLYEKDGQLSMIPWDYNLAYGTFMGGNASSSVNAPIDTPVSNGMEDRPMISWIFDNEDYTEQYHELFSEFVNSTDFAALVSDTAEMIDKYVEKDPTKFCTYDEFKKGVEAISGFCTLRSESVKGQLDGTIPSTSEGQSADSSALIDCSSLNLSDMGSMGGNGGGFGGKGMPDMGGFGGFGSKDKSSDDSTDKSTEDSSADSSSAELLSSVKVLNTPAPAKAANLSEKKSPSGKRPEGFDPSNMPEDFDPSNMPDGFDPSNMQGGFDPSNMPEDFDPSNMPEDFDPSNMPGGFGGKDKQTDTSDESKNTEKPSESESTENEDTAKEKQNDRQGGMMQRPSGGDDKNAGGRMPQGGEFSPNGSNAGSRTVPLVLVGVSAGVLLFGLIFAFKFKRK